MKKVMLAGIIVLAALNATVSAGEFPPESVVPEAREDDEGVTEPVTRSVMSSYWGPDVFRWGPLIERHAEARNLDPDLVAAVMTVESKGDPNAVSYSGATGLMQVMPLWGRPPVSELLNPETNVAWGTRILADNIRWAKGDLVMALGAYFDGRKRARERWPRTVAYANNVMTLYGSAGNRSTTLQARLRAIQAERIRDVDVPPVPSERPYRRHNPAIE